jgi:hypothetical protein
MGSFYCRNADTDYGKGGWVNRDQQNQCLIDDKALAQKIFKLVGKLSKSNLQLMELDIPDAEYGKIIDEINENRLKMAKMSGGSGDSRAELKGEEHHSAHSSKDIAKASKAAQEAHAKDYIGGK